ncbi:MAG TPA: class I SAM-dependent methyltransferase [Kofleriaceae bacterium]|nr:class I SAM-dependent methyltransferase [Kofleriaceae bacterium]
MDRALLVLLAVACAKPPTPNCPTQPVVASPAPEPATPKPPELDNAAVISQSHAFFDAHDKADLAAFQALVGTGFARFARARFYDAAHYANELAARVARKAPTPTRTCTDERVVLTPANAVYLGNCIVTMPAHGETPRSSATAWETIVWAPEGDVWKVVHWGWQRGGIEAEREDWNDVFRVSTNFKRTANQFLIDVTKRRRPGAALDIAMGQGRNALYLASQRWRVTGVDISDEGLRIAKEKAAEQKLKLEAVQQDIEQYELGTGRWDLVTLIYAGDDVKLLERIKPSVRRGGLVVIEFFHADAVKGTGIGSFEAGELAKVFAGWKIVRDEVVEDVADWGLRKTKLVRFAAEKQ